MTARKPKAKPGWSDVKSQLIGFDRAGLIELVRHLYTASKENQAFLHARFALRNDVLEPYKKTIARWLGPDVCTNQDISLSKAKKAISDYKKAVGQPAGLAELMVFYCEQAAGFSQDIGLQDEGYFEALVRMFEQALKVLMTFPTAERDSLWERMDRVRRMSHGFGYGVGDDMDYLLAKVD